MSHRLALTALLLLAGTAGAQTTEPASGEITPSREHLAPAGMERAYHEWHYTPVVKVGDTVIVSGIPAGPGDTYAAKVRRMFDVLQKHLASAGATMADVVEITTYHAGATDSATFMKEFTEFSKIHHEYFRDHYPAWTAVGNTTLLSAPSPVEIRAIAVIGSGKNPKADIPKPASAQH